MDRQYLVPSCPPCWPRLEWSVQIRRKIKENLSSTEIPIRIYFFLFLSVSRYLYLPVFPTVCTVFTVHWKRAWKYEMKILPQFFFRCARSCHVGRQHKFLEKNCFLKASAINEGKWHIQASCFGVLKISVKNTSVLKFLFCRINSCQFEFLCKLDKKLIYELNWIINPSKHQIYRTVNFI